jgi:hypothetical protein
MNPYAHLIFDKGPKTYIREKTDFSTNVARKTGYLLAEKLKLDPCLSLFSNINSKWMNDSNVRPGTLKLVKERAGNTLKLIDNYFLNSTQMAQQLREKIDKWNYMKLESFCTTKVMATRLKRQPTEWGKIFASYTSDKGLMTRD